MQITRLTVAHYRNVTQQTFNFDKNLTILWGQNGVGKTNVLEAISMLSLPRSFRGSKDDQVRQWDSDFTRIEGLIDADESSTRSLVVFWDSGKKLLSDGKPVTTTEFVGQFLSIVFAPEEVDLLSGTPSRRRSFLDSHIAQLSRSYFIHLLHYQKVLTRKNRLLSSRASTSELEYWNGQQVIHGSAIVKMRQEHVDRLNTLLFPTLRIEYQSNIVESDRAIETVFHEKQASYLDRERSIGHALLGPQRDDWRLIELSPDIRDIGLYGSRGEQRMGVVKLKQVQLADIFNQTGHQAVLLLDDVLSELDANHQAALFESLGHQQTIMTAASLAEVPPNFLESAQVFEKSDEAWTVSSQ